MFLKLKASLNSFIPFPDAASTKPYGFMPFYPGPGLGGHCIPIDPFYLTWKAKQLGINTRFIELAGEINTNMPKYTGIRMPWYPGAWVLGYPGIRAPGMPGYPNT